MNRELCDFLSKPTSTKQLILFQMGFKKLTGNDQRNVLLVRRFFRRLISRHSKAAQSIKHASSSNSSSLTLAPGRLR